MIKQPAATFLLPLAISLSTGAGCGPQLGPEPAFATGLYRAEVLRAEDDCGETGVWSSDVTHGYARDYFDGLYSDPVPVRASGEALVIPEPVPLGLGVDAPPVQVWTMVRLVGADTALYREEAFDLSYCDDYRHAWSVDALDDEAFVVTREGYGCGAGDGQSGICDNVLTIAYELVDACPAACELTGEAIDGLSDAEQGDLLGDNPRCTC